MGRRRPGAGRALAPGWAGLIAFSPDARRLAVAADERGTARVSFARFSPGGRLLVTSGAGGKVIVGHARTQKPIGAPLAPAPGAYPSVALSSSHVNAISTLKPVCQS